MRKAIATLEEAMKTLVTNEPINRSEGKIEQADCEVEGIKDIRAALAVLRVIDIAAARPLDDGEGRAALHEIIDVWPW